MEQDLLQQQSNTDQPIPSPVQPIAPHDAPLKNQKLLWLLAGIFVLLIGIGIGTFLMHPS